MTMLRRLLSTVLVATLFLGLLTPGASAADQLDQGQSQQDGRRTVTLAEPGAQVFTVGHTGLMTKVSALVTRPSGWGDLIAQIRPVAGEAPDSTVLASGSVYAADVPESGGATWVEFLLNTPLTVSPGERYALVLTPSDDSTTYSWYFKSNNPYPDGEQWMQNADGSWSLWGIYDFTFKTYIDIPASDASLAGLTLSAGYLTPKFSSTWHEYTVKVPSATSELVVTPTLNDPNASVTVNGNPPTQAVPLLYGENQIDIAVTAEDGTGQLYSLYVNRPKSTMTTLAVAAITGPGDRTVNEDTVIGPLEYSITGMEPEVTVTARSSDQSLIADDQINLTKVDSTTWRMSITPVANAVGSAQVTVEAVDANTTLTDTITITLNQVNDPPFVEPIDDLGLLPDTTSEQIPLLISDDLTPSGDLTVTFTVINPTLLPNSAITIGGSGASRHVTIKPATGETGEGVVRLSVSDGTLSTTEDIYVRVLPPPTISDVTDQSVAQNGSLNLGLTVDDADGNDLDMVLTGTSDNQDLVPNANIVFGGSGAARTVKITPVSGRVGTAEITLQVSDGFFTDSTTFTLTVNQGAAPSISAIADQTVDEDEGIGPLSFTVGDSDTPLANLSITATSNNQALVPNANVVLGGTGANRRVTVTPLPETSGSAEITISVADGTDTATERFTVTVNNVNDKPVITGLSSRTIAEDSASFTFDFTVSDAETPAGELTVSVESSDTTLIPSSHIATNNGGSVSVTMNPVADRFGVATITVTVSDGTQTTTGSFSLTITNVNDGPTMSPIANQTTTEDQAVVVHFTVNDVDNAANTLQFSRSSSLKVLVPDANIVVGGTGTNRTATITPAANQNGTTTITLTVNDGSAIASRSFNLVVSPVNDPPTISNILDRTVAMNAPVPAINFTVQDLETPSSSLNITATSSNQALLSDANLTVSGSQTNWSVLPTLTNGMTGQTTITVTVSDGELEASDSFVLTVSQAPTISAIDNMTIVEDSTTGPIAFTINDPDTDLSQLLVSGSSDNQHVVPNGNITISGSGSARQVVVKPAPNAYGTALITITVTDGGNQTTETFTLTVNSVNDPPTITELFDYATGEDRPTPPLAFTIDDVETAPNSLRVSASSSNPALVPTANIIFGGTFKSRNVTITPAAGMSGVATITIAVTDGVATATTSFVLTVTSVNDAPVIIAPSTFAGTEDTPSSINVAVVDGDSETSSLSILVNSLNQGLVPNENIGISGSPGAWTLNITPAPDAAGTVPIQITVSDGEQVSNSTINFVIAQVNDLPTISSITDVGTPEDTPTAPLTFVVGDIENAPGQLTVTATSDNPILLPSTGLIVGGMGPNRTLTISPAQDQFGSATVFVSVEDTDGGKRTTSLIVTVTPVADAPRVTGFVDTTIDEDTPLSMNMGLTDPDSPEASVTFTLVSSNDSLLPTASLSLTGSGANRVLTGTPVENLHGTTTLTLEATDGGLTTLVAIIVTVAPVNDLPVVTALTNQETLEEVPTQSQSFTITDVETAAMDLVVTADSSDPAVVPSANIHLGGSGTERTVYVTPAQDRTGPVTINIHVNDGTQTTTTSYTLTIRGINDPPAFTVGPDVVVDEDAGAQSIATWLASVSPGPFEPEQHVSFSVTHDNPGLFAVAPHVSGDGTLTFTSAENQFGSAFVTLTIKDDGGTQNGGVDTAESQSFTITVNPVNDAPTVTHVPLVGTEMGVATPPIILSLADVESAATALTLSATSSDQSIVPNSNIFIGGSGADRYLTLNPIARQTGSVVITLAVSDGLTTTTSELELRVSNVFLASVESSLGQLVPEFAESVVTYKAIYNRNATEAFVTPTAQDPINMITVNGLPVVSGEVSPAIPLAGEGGEVKIEVTAPDTGVKKLYVIDYVRARSSVSDLIDLAISPGTLEPLFKPEVTRYTARVGPEVSEVTVTATPGDSHAQVAIKGNTQLRSGTNTITVTVTAENGIKQDYTISVYREPPPLSIKDVRIVASADSASVLFGTSAGAHAEVFVVPDHEEENQAGSLETGGIPAGSGDSHAAEVKDLEPSTTYRIRISAVAGEYKAEYAASFTTALVSADQMICRGGEIKTEKVGLVSLNCPGDHKAVEAVNDSLLVTPPEGSLAVSAVGQSEVVLALSQAMRGIKGQNRAELVVNAAEGRPLKAVVVDSLAARLAIQAAADLSVDSSLARLTLPPITMATMIQGGEGGNVIVVFESIDQDRADIRAQLSRAEWKTVSAVVDATASTLYSDGWVERHTTLVEPLTLTLKFDKSKVANPDLLGIFQLIEDEQGEVVDRRYVGGVVDMAQGTISVELTHLSKYVVLSYEHQFSDLPQSHWAYKTIQQMLAREIAEGLSPTRFGPDMPVTRGQFASMITRAFNLERAPHLTKGYTDVPEESETAGEIGAVMKAGLMVGYPDATFRPDAQITRQEMATVLHRLITRLQIQVVPPAKNGARITGFADRAQISDWSWEAVERMVDLGLMTGRPGPTFVPGGFTTRAEAVTVVKRLMDLMAHAEQ